MGTWITEDPDGEIVLVKAANPDNDDDEKRGEPQWA